MAAGERRMPKPKQVFISHSNQDRDFVEREVIGLLQSHGIETWYSGDDTQTASQWQRTILAGLESCDWFLVVLSPRSIVSKWVTAEVDWALENREEAFAPVLMEECDWKSFYLLLRNYQHADFSSDLKDGKKRLLKTWRIEAKSDGETNPAAYYNQGNAANHLKKYDKAIADYSEAIRLNPQFDLAYCGRGASYNNLRKFDKAIADFTVAIRLRPNYPAAYRLRAIAYRSLGNTAEAMADDKRAKELEQ